MSDYCEHVQVHHYWITEYDEDGELQGRWEERTVSLYEDISIGAFKCRRCGHIGYYTGLWRDYYENGVPCFGSEGIDRNLK